MKKKDSLRLDNMILGILRDHVATPAMIWAELSGMGVETDKKCLYQRLLKLKNKGIIARPFSNTYDAYPFKSKVNLK